MARNFAMKVGLPFLLEKDVCFFHIAHIFCFFSNENQARGFFQRTCSIDAQKKNQFMYSHLFDVRSTLEAFGIPPEI